MSEPMHDDSSVPEPSGPGRLSPLAVVAVVLAAIPMCVPVNLLGFVFGVLALRRIRLSAGMWRGVGVAQCHCCLSTIKMKLPTGTSRVLSMSGFLAISK